MPKEEREVRKTVTVLFADVAGSTSLGERLDPESLRQIMTRYFDVARTALERHGGTVEKFIGDAVMAVFGVPAVHEDDALRAARAAIDLREGVVRLNQELQAAFGACLQVRTGINTGEVVAGDPAVGESFVSGDIVNVAARLEQAAQPDEILIGAQTLRLVRDAVRVEPVEPLTLKGKPEPVSAFQLLEVLPGAPALARRLDSPMVGRKAELRQLSEAFDRVERQSACQLVTLVGVAGVGKTRLVRELCSRLAGRARILEGRCLSYGEGITFWPVAEIVKHAAGINDSDSPDEARAKIAATLSSDDPDDATLLMDRIGSAIGLGEAQGAIQETFWALRRMLEILAVDRSLIAVIDDIHWAEHTLLDLIEYVAGFSRGRPILLLCLARPELHEVRPDWSRAGSTLVLKPLEPSQSELLIRNLFGRARLSVEMQGRIVEAADGNPLYVEEMVRTLLDDGAARRDSRDWVIKEDVSRVGAPATIQALIAARLDRLGDDERAIVQRASVVGKVFYWGAVTQLSPEDGRGAVGMHLQTLLRKELIEPQPSSFAGEDAFRFSHTLIRDVAYESIPKRVRADLHERFASWLERVAGPRVPEYEEILGYHLEQAHQYLAQLGAIDERGRALAGRAATHLTSAGRRSHARGDMPATARLLSRAIELLPDDAPERCELLLLTGAALTHSGEFERSDAMLSDAIEASRRAGEQGLESRSVTRLVWLRLHSRGYENERAALPDVDRAIRLAEAAADDIALAEAWRVRGLVQFWQGRAADGSEDLERSLRFARTGADQRVVTETLWWLGITVVHGPTPAASGVERLNELAEWSGGDRTLTFHALRLRSELEAMQGRFELARAHVEQAKELGRELGLETYYASGALRHSAYIAMLADDPERAVIELSEAVEILRRIGDKGHLASVAPEYADGLIQLRRYEEAERWLAVGRECTTEGDVDAQVNGYRVQAKLLARQGNFGEALALARAGVRLSAPTDYLELRARALMDLAEVLRLAGRTDEALPVVRQALQLFERKGNVVSAARARVVLQESNASG